MPPKTPKDKAFHRALDVHAFQTSNVTSSHFLGSAPRSWMLNSAAANNNDIPAHSPSPTRQNPNPIETNVTKQPLDTNSSLKYGPNSVTAEIQTGRELETRAADAMGNIHEAARQQVSIAGQSPASNPPIEPTSNLSPHETAEPTPDQGSSRPPENPATSTALRCTSSNDVPVSSAPSRPADVVDAGRGMLQTQVLPVRDGHAAPQDAQADLLTQSSIPERSNTDDPRRTPPRTSTISPAVALGAPPPVTDDLVVLCTDTVNPDNPQASTVMPATAHHQPLPLSRPSANPETSGGSNKRYLDLSNSDERRVRARTGSRGGDPQTQLPTPQDSPITTSNTILSNQFEMAMKNLIARGLSLGLMHAIDQHRIFMMEEACRLNDLFFIALNALFCLSSTVQWPTLSRFNITEAHFQGFQVLASILGPCQNLSPDVFQMFTLFPQPLAVLTQDSSPDFAVLMEEIRCFLFHLGCGFATLQGAALRQNLPPCAAQFKFSLKLQSIVLQRALFTSVLRQWDANPAWLAEALQLFENDMNDPVGSAISLVELNAYNGVQLMQIGNRWKLLYEQHRARYQNAIMARTAAQAKQTQAGATSSPGSILPSQGSVAPDRVTPVSSNARSHASSHHHLLQSVHPPQIRPPNAKTQSQHSLSQTRPQNSTMSNSSSAHPSSPHYQSSSAPSFHGRNHRPLHLVQTPGTLPVNPTTAPGPLQPQNLESPQQLQFSPGVTTTRRTPSGLSAISSHLDKLPTQQVQTSLPTTPTMRTSPGDSHRVPVVLTPGRRGAPKKVLAIVGERQRNGRTEFRVRYKVPGLSETWEPEHHLQGASQAVAMFRSNLIASDVHGHQHTPHNNQMRTHVDTADARSDPVLQHMQGHQVVNTLVHGNGLMPVIRAPQHASEQASLPPGQSSTSGSQQRSSSILGAATSTHSGPLPGHGPAELSTFPPPFSNSTNLVASSMQTAVGARQFIVMQEPQPRQSTPPQPGQAFFEPDFTLPQIARPNPDILALHQVELRSPEYHPMEEPEKSDARFYQYVEDVIALPEPITKNSDLIRLRVQIPPEALARRTVAIPAVGEFSRRQRNVSDGDAQFRLRSIATAESPEWIMSNLSEVCTQPTRWPKCLSVSVNEHVGLDFRRKPHHGVDMATDITEMLHEDENEIVIGAIFTPQELTLKFVMLLEIIHVAEHDSLLKTPVRISASEALGAITNTLRNQGDKDDELIINQPMISIDIVDPFMSVIWVTPVRGKLCLHRECFDFEAFLSSRTSTSSSSETCMSSPDKWFCPICKSDCRPPLLVLDEFLLGVRKTLEEKNQLHAKAILVKEDGSWEPKLGPVSNEEGEQMSDADIADNARQAGKTAQLVVNPEQVPTAITPRAATTPRTIIVLDDDDD